MVEKNVVLSKKGAYLLDTLIERHGLIVTADQIFDVLKKDHTRQQAYNVVSKMTAAGWLVRLKKSLYYITSLESRGYAGVSQFVVAQFLDRSSYISFEAALQYHGMFDQLLGTVRSATTGKNKKFIFQDTIYSFAHVQQKHFFGFTEEYKENQKILVADAEKALVDILHFRRNVNDIDIVLEKLQEHRAELDLKKLVSFAQRDTLTVARMLGFLLDASGAEAEALYAYVREKKGFSTMIGDREQAHYSARWKLYYHDHFKKYIHQ